MVRYRRKHVDWHFAECEVRVANGTSTATERGAPAAHEMHKGAIAN